MKNMFSSSGTSVVARISEIKQPYGGYLNPKEFDAQMLSADFNDIMILAHHENILPVHTGLAVDYLTRFMITRDVSKAFEISVLGAQFAARYNKDIDYKKYISNIRDLSDESIINAVMLVRYDMYYRNPEYALKTAWNYNIPDRATVNSIRVMVKRSLDFFEKYGPATHYGFQFRPEAFGEYIISGDGDFLTKDTMWDFKVSKNQITSKHTLQILIYYVLGLRSGEDYYKNIKYLGFFNPRLNIIYTISVSKISDELIKIIETDIIG